ncbi:hypothetical protein [Rufibacter latericius]|uniref:Lipoprotein n=1 Tax=Rufibacter latericius TaxID=2487040 RepID=A0A3M9MJQ8_9BACT|nr:hypothetical protein [Rufibacter latericius]RNI25789.1 hypothetical protein EFB08_13130 [Rufibacter latericius]
MSTRLLFPSLLLIFLGACGFPKYLPSTDQIDVHQYGSYIKLQPKQGALIKGELIAASDSSLVLLTEPAGECLTIHQSAIRQYRIQYAQPKRYGWSIPVYTLFTLAHGYYGAFTLPLNLLVTTAVTIGGINSFSYEGKGKTLTFSGLDKFARFPQGIPRGLKLANLKPAPK